MHHHVGGLEIAVDDFHRVQERHAAVRQKQRQYISSALKLTNIKCLGLDIPCNIFDDVNACHQAERRVSLVDELEQAAQAGGRLPAPPPRSATRTACPRNILSR